MKSEDLNKYFNQETKVDNIDDIKSTTFISSYLKNCGLDDQYISEGNVEILKSERIEYFSVKLQNFFQKRIIKEDFVPNFSNVPNVKKNRTDFNVWDYEIEYSNLFNEENKLFEISESHHSKNCSTCKSRGEITCSNCRGRGQQRCSGCLGKGQIRCSSCNGSGDKMCLWCLGKGTTSSYESGRTVNKRCNSCGGRGRNPCTSCSNGYLTCGSCSGGGQVDCYGCHGRGQVECYTCQGIGSLDYFYLIEAQFYNSNKEYLISEPIKGFSKNDNQFNKLVVEETLGDLQKKEFTTKDFINVKSKDLKNGLTDFFKMKSGSSIKLIHSKISFIRNIYHQLKFKFNDEIYFAFLDKNFSNIEFLGKKPTDDYEFDILRKILLYSKENEIDKISKSLESFRNYSYFDINESELVQNLKDTKIILESANFFESKKFISCELKLKNVSQEKKLEEDYKTLRRNLTRIYLKESILISSVFIIPFLFYVYDYNMDFVLGYSSIFLASLILNLILTRFSRNLWNNRIAAILIMLFSSVLIFWDSSVRPQGELMSYQKKKKEFNEYKEKNKLLIIEPNDTIIFLKETGEKKRFYYIPKGVNYRYNGSTFKSEKEIPIRIIYSDSDFDNRLKRTESNSDIIIDMDSKALVVNKFDIKYIDDYYIEIEYYPNNVDNYFNNYKLKKFIDGDLINEKDNYNEVKSIKRSFDPKLDFKIDPVKFNFKNLIYSYYESINSFEINKLISFWSDKNIVQYFNEVYPSKSLIKSSYLNSFTNYSIFKNLVKSISQLDEFIFDVELVFENKSKNSNFISRSQEKIRIKFNSNGKIISLISIEPSKKINAPKNPIQKNNSAKKTTQTNKKYNFKKGDPQPKRDDYKEYNDFIVARDEWVKAGNIWNSNKINLKGLDFKDISSSAKKKKRYEIKNGYNKKFKFNLNVPLRFKDNLVDYKLRLLLDGILSGNNSLVIDIGYKGKNFDYKQWVLEIEDEERVHDDSYTGETVNKLGNFLVRNVYLNKKPKSIEFIAILNVKNTYPEIKIKYSPPTGYIFNLESGKLEKFGLEFIENLSF